jgi:MscS family membrane protein
MLEWLAPGENVWVVQVFGVVLGTLLLRFAVKLVLDRVARQLESTNNLYDDALLEAARRPLGWFIWIMGIAFAAETVAPHAESDLFGFINPIREVSVIFLLAWFAVRCIRFVEVHVTDSSYREAPVDRTTASAVGKLLRASVVITAVLICLQSLGFSVSGVLAFGGIGGIAVGFAARDLLANFFGALMIFMDRPFSVGDWVRSPDRNIEGTVEEIGWRLTRIRTFDARPLYVPNSVFMSISVETPSRMTNRRIYETIGLRYDDVAVIPAILESIREMLGNHPAIDTKRTLMVNFNAFGPSALDFFIYTFTRTTVWTEYHEIKEAVLLKVAEIIAAHGAQIAFPTQTLHIASAAEPEGPVA